MYKEAAGTVISVKKQWWLKVNAKRVRLHAMDGAMFPHIVKVEYLRCQSLHNRFPYQNHRCRGNP